MKVRTLPFVCVCTSGAWRFASSQRRGGREWKFGSETSRGIIPLLPEEVVIGSKGVVCGECGESQALFSAAGASWGAPADCVVKHHTWQDGQNTRKPVDIIKHECVMAFFSPHVWSLAVTFAQLHTARMTPCRRVTSLTINQLAGMDCDNMYSFYTWEQLPSRVTWCYFIGLSQLFFSKWAWWELARCESRTQDECFSFKTAASFSSAFESHQSRSRKHVIGSSWGKFPPSERNCIVLSGDWGNHSHTL